ncbi:MAG: hypothetical protein J6I69_02290 [Bacilli bacterium]|nr:hypothetical protein [Bacilli bacterium]
MKKINVFEIYEQDNKIVERRTLEGVTRKQCFQQLFDIEKELNNYTYLHWYFEEENLYRDEYTAFKLRRLKK